MTQQELEQMVVGLKAVADALLLVAESMTPGYRVESDRLGSHDIIQVVANTMRTTVDEIKSPTRTKALTKARHITMALMKEYTTMSYPEIGTALNRDHTSVVHALNNLGDRLADDPKLEADYSALNKYFQQRIEKYNNLSEAGG